jgi:hypothetical protein
MEGMMETTNESLQGRIQQLERRIAQNEDETRILRLRLSMAKRTLEEIADLADRLAQVD